MRALARPVFITGGAYVLRAIPKTTRDGYCYEYFGALRSHISHVHSTIPVLPPYLVSRHAGALSFLIAEDDDELRFIIVHLLQEEFPHAQVAAYANGRDALQHFDTNGAHLVVSNHSMPVMDGPTFVRQLRMRSSSLPILMVSGSPEARQEGRAAGISWFLDKDELYSHLVATVRSLMENLEICCTAPRGSLQQSRR